MVERALVLTDQKRYVLLPIALAIGFVGYVFLTQSLRSGIPDHGDWWTDVAHLATARILVEQGFVSLRFGAARDDGGTIGLDPFYYTHAPAFPAVVLGLLLRLGLSPAEARIAPLIVASSALVAIYLLGRQIFGNWRAGLMASFALAASAPFRLLSDAYAYPSYDFAAKAWTLLFITLASQTLGRRRLAWLLAAGAGAFAAIGLSGFEMVPAIAAYSVLCPALFATTVGSKGRVSAVLASGTFVAGGLVAGMLFRLAHNYWLQGNLQSVLGDFLAAYSRRSSTDFQFIWEGGYISFATSDYALYYATMLINRVLAYYPILVLLIVAGLFVGLVAGVSNRLGGLQPLKWLAIVFVSELLWFLIFREHTNMHSHTIYQLSLSLSLAAALALMVFWQLAGRSHLGQLVVAMAGLALFAASLMNVGLQPRGNLTLYQDLNPQKQEIQSFSALLPANAVVLLDTVGDPTPDYFINRTFVRRIWVKELTGLKERPWYLLTKPSPDNAVYQKALLKNPLLKKTQEFALFDMNAEVPAPGSKLGETGAAVSGKN